MFGLLEDSTSQLNSVQQLLVTYKQKADMQMAPAAREEMNRKHSEYAAKVSSYKAKVEEGKRQALLQQVPSSANSQSIPSTPFQPVGDLMYARPGGSSAVETSASQALSREAKSLHTSIAMTDMYLSQLEDGKRSLAEQRTMLEASLRRISDIASTLGMSRDVVNWIERRSRQDLYIFYAGVTTIMLMFGGWWWYYRR
eukprot:Partr_v1_DN25643_c0_g1_i2_m4703 putative GOlgi Snap Receptor complex member